MLYASAMRYAFAAVSLAVALSSVGVPAIAQKPQDQTAPKRYKAQPLNLHKEQLGTTAYVAAARSRMKAGDCEGAITAFDEALRTSNQDPTLYRDRGLCHEKLGHPYPAIDDYREYLTEAPDAADVAGIRERLSRLEDETSGRSSSNAANDDTNVPPANAIATEGAGEAPGSAPPPHDKVQAYDEEDDALNVPLRRGRGFSLSPLFSVRKWFFKGSTFGDAQTWSEAIGGRLAYAIGPIGGFLLEVGYEHFNSTNLDPFVVSGLTSQLGFEFRFPLARDYDNQLFLAPGLGYEHLGFTPSDPTVRASDANALVPRLRFGYRHLVQDAAALEVSVDGGVAEWLGSSASALNLSSTVMLAANVAVVWGL
jgi:tetratricopeptide (TPR) repeat protein